MERPPFADQVISQLLIRGIKKINYNARLMTNTQSSNYGSCAELGMYWKTAEVLIRIDTDRTGSSEKPSIG
jgi:hypothetical protein